MAEENSLNQQVYHWKNTIMLSTGELLPLNQDVNTVLRKEIKNRSRGVMRLCVGIE